MTMTVFKKKAMLDNLTEVKEIKLKCTNKVS